MSKKQQAAGPDEPMAEELLFKYEQFQKRLEATPRWIEVPLAQAPPKALIGRCCKVLWPLDEEWYKGVIFSYDSHTKKHLVVYYGYESEWLLLSKERILLHLPSGDKLLALKDTSKPDGGSQEPRGSAHAAADTVEGGREQQAADVQESPSKRARKSDAQTDEAHFRPGCVVWAKIQGFPWWPAMVTHASRAEPLGWTRAVGSTCCLLQYFGPKVEVGTAARKALLPFAAGVARGYHQESKKKYRMDFRTGMAQVQRLLETGELPQGMQPWGDLEESGDDESEGEGRPRSPKGLVAMSEEEDEGVEGDRPGGATKRSLGQQDGSRGAVRDLAGSLLEAGGRGMEERDASSSPEKPPRPGSYPSTTTPSPRADQVRPGGREVPLGSCGRDHEMVAAENRCLVVSPASGGAQLATPHARPPSSPVTLPKAVSKLLALVAHGDIVTSSPHFHTASFIYPLGYTAIRTFPSMKDPRMRVEYRMEILSQAACSQEARSQAGKGGREGNQGAIVEQGADRPLFRVTPEDCPELAFEGKDPSACWTEIRKRVQLARAQLVSPPGAQGDRDGRGQEAAQIDLKGAAEAPQSQAKGRLVLSQLPAAGGGKTKGRLVLSQLPAAGGGKTDAEAPKQERAESVNAEMALEQPAQRVVAPAAGTSSLPAVVSAEDAGSGQKRQHAGEGAGELQGSGPCSVGASSVKLEPGGHMPPECMLPVHKEPITLEPSQYSDPDLSLSPSAAPAGRRQRSASGLEPKASGGGDSQPAGKAKRQQVKLTALWRGAKKAKKLPEASPTGQPEQLQGQTETATEGVRSVQSNAREHSTDIGDREPWQKRQDKGGSSTFRQPEGALQPCSGGRRQEGSAGAAGQGKEHVVDAEAGETEMLPEPPLEMHHFLSATFDDGPELFSFPELDYSLAPLVLNDPSCLPPAKLEDQPTNRRTAPWGMAGCREEGLENACSGLSDLRPDKGLAPSQQNRATEGQAGERSTRSRDQGKAVQKMAGLTEEGLPHTSGAGSQLEGKGPAQERRGYSSAMIKAASTTDNEVFHPDGTPFLPSARCRSGAHMFGFDVAMVQEILQTLPNAHMGCPNFRAWRPGLTPTAGPQLLEGRESGGSAKKRDGREDEAEGTCLRLLCSGSTLPTAELAAPDSAGGAHTGALEGGGRERPVPHPGPAGLEGRAKRRKLTEEGLLMERSEGSNEVEVADSGDNNPAVGRTSVAERAGSKGKALKPLEAAAGGQGRPERGAGGGRTSRGTADKGRTNGCAAPTPTPGECSSPSPAPKPGCASHKKAKTGSAAAAATAQGGAQVVVYDRDITSERCDVCYMSEEYDNNQLLQCDKCRMMVHMDCYGVTEPPDGDLWLCQTCDEEALEEYRQSWLKAGKRRALPDDGPPACALCPVQGGAMKRSTEGGWVHVVCTLWIPETCFLDVRLMEPVDGIKRIPKARRQLRCGLCKVQHGVCVQCAYSKCCASFHPLCARYHGLHMRAVDESESKQFKLHGTMLGSVVLVAFCKRHGGSVKGLSQDASQASLPEPPQGGKRDPQRKGDSPTQRKGDSAGQQPALMLEAGTEAVGPGESRAGAERTAAAEGAEVVGEAAAGTSRPSAHRSSEPPPLAAASTSSHAHPSVCSADPTIAPRQGAGMVGAAGVSFDGSGSDSGSDEEEGEDEEDEEEAAGGERGRPEDEADSDSEKLDCAGLRLSSDASNPGLALQGSRQKSGESEGQLHSDEQGLGRSAAVPEASPAGPASSEAQGAAKQGRKLFEEEPANAPPIVRGCARAEFYDWSCRRSRKGPEAVAAALAKRSFLESIPYVVSGRRRRQQPLCSLTTLRGKGAHPGSQEQWQGESGRSPKDRSSMGSAPVPPGRAMNAHQAAELLTPHQMVSKWEAARLVFEASNLVWDLEQGRRKARPGPVDLQEDDDPLGFTGTVPGEGQEPTAKRSLGHTATSSCSSTSSTPERKAGSQAPGSAFRQEPASRPGAPRSRHQSLPGRSEGGELLSMSERFRRVKSSLSLRLAFGKSAIHGWGVFARVPHAAGDMMIEYAGQVVRPIVADMRERRLYNDLVGAGTYMFRVDEGRVVDATRAGSIAHLINHSCQPNCFSRVVSASGEERVIIFARRNIQVGEELTYDYRFQSRDEEQLQCNCGAPACRGVVNKEEGEEDDDDLTFGPQDSSTFRLPVVAPLSQLQRLPKPNLHKRGADMVIGTTGERETVGV